MPPQSRSNYGARLPNTLWERKGLKRVRWMQTVLLVWLAALIPASWLISLMPNARMAFVPIVIGWLGAGVGCGWRGGLIRCPRCREPFHGVLRFPYFHTIFTRRCANCGLTLPRSGIASVSTR
ncbi:MAG: hypothetical protein ACREQN_18765 [Candidatus Binataceae bacterium]